MLVAVPVSVLQAKAVVLVRLCPLRLDQAVEGAFYVMRPFGQGLSPKCVWTHSGFSASALPYSDIYSERWFTEW